MIKKLCIAVIAVMSVLHARAQEGATASPYSFFGIGTQQFKGTAENRSMGGLSIFSDETRFNLVNPASLGKRRFTSFSIGGTHSEITQKQDGLEAETSATRLNYMAIGFPITKKMGLSFGLVPFSSVGYDIRTGDDEVFNIFEGKGGINRVFLSTGFQIMDGLYIGATANYNFGNLQNDVVSTQEDVELGTRERNRSDLSGLNFNFGVQYDRMITDKLELSLSASYAPGSDIKAENTRTFSSVIFNNLGLLTDLDIRDVNAPNTTFNFPASATIGAGIGKERVWFAGAEFAARRASTFGSSRFDLSGVTFRRSSTVKLGGWYTPKFNSIRSYWDRITYRAGTRFEKVGLDIQGEEIEEFGISFGLGLPAGRFGSNINLGFELGQRGTTNAGLVQENFASVFLSFSFNDVWFLKTKFN